MHLLYNYFGNEYIYIYKIKEEEEEEEEKRAKFVGDFLNKIKSLRTLPRQCIEWKRKLINLSLQKCLLFGSY